MCLMHIECHVGTSCSPVTFFYVNLMSYKEKDMLDNCRRPELES